MLYSKHILFPSNQTEATKTVAHFHINKGWIYRAWLIFPLGCAGLVKVRIEHKGHPIIPVNKSDYVRADGYTFELPMFYEVKTTPYQITFEGWNEDDIYDHTITLMLLVLPKAFILPVGAVEGVMESLSNLIIRKSEPGEKEELT